MRRACGLTIVEVLIAMVLLMVIMAAIMPLFPSAIVSNKNSRMRSQATAVAETWLDRYRNKQEPLAAAGSLCSETTDPDSSQPVVTCSYPADHDYGADSATIPSHNAGMNGQMAPFSTVITATKLRAGASSAQWLVQVKVSWQQVKEAGGVNLATKIDN